MEDKAQKERAKMNRQEYLLNKPILKEINDKKRTSQYGGFGTLSKAGETISARDQMSLYNQQN